MLPESPDTAENWLDPRLLLTAVRRILSKPPGTSLRVEEVLRVFGEQNFPLQAFSQALSRSRVRAKVEYEADFVKDLEGAAWSAAVTADRQRYREARDAFQMLNDRWSSEGIQAMCLKAAGFLPSFPYRSRAVDALVRPEYSELARRLLLDLGYIEMRNVQEPGKWLFRRFEIGQSVMAVHLHTGIRWQEEFAALDGLWNHARPAPDDRALLVPGREDVVLINIAHVMMQKREMNLHDLVKLRWALSVDSFDWSYVARVLDTRGWADGFAFGLLLFGRVEDALWGDTVIPPSVYLDAQWRVERNPLLRSQLPATSFSPVLPCKVPGVATVFAFYGKIWQDRDLIPGQRLAHTVASGMRDVRRVLGIKPQNSMLITLSGIDGSGKSSHTAALLDAFGSAGIRIGWVTARIGNRTPLRSLLQHVRSVRYRRRRSNDSPATAAAPGGKTVEGHWRGWRLSLWALATAADYAVWLQYVRWKLLRGNVVVSDRYVCDFAVEFSILVKSQPRLMALLLKPVWWLAPKPERSYFLRIRPEISQARKPDDQHGYDHFQVVAVYDDIHRRYGLRALDNHEAFEQVAGTIVHETLSTYMQRFHPWLNQIFLSNPHQMNPQSKHRDHDPHRDPDV